MGLTSQWSFSFYFRLATLNVSSAKHNNWRNTAGDIMAIRTGSLLETPLKQTQAHFIESIKNNLKSKS